MFSKPCLRFFSKRFGLHFKAFWTKIENTHSVYISLI